MDEIDREIIRILSKDARTPFSRIGKMLGIGTDTVFRRFKKLQQDDIIQGCSVVLDSRSCGFMCLIGFYAKTKPGASLLNAKSTTPESF